MKNKYPKGWKKTKLADLGECFIGLTYSPTDVVKTGGTLVLRSSNIQNGKLCFEDQVHVRTSIPQKIRTLEHDILVCVRNGSRNLIGKAAIIRGEAVGQTFGAFMAIYRSKSSAFVYQLLQTNRFKRQVESNLGATINQITNSQFNALTFYIPPDNEQIESAKVLGTWDEAFEKLDALIDAKERRKQALMQQLLTGSKRFPAFGKKAWTKVRMNQVLERVFRPIVWSAEMSLSLISIRRRCGGLFRRPDLLGSEYKTQDLHELKAGDFLVSKRQVVHGAWAMVTPDFEGGHVSKEYAIFDNIAPDKLHMPFLAWLAQTPRMIRLARVASTGVHIEKLIFDPDVFLRESIRIPADLAEQRKIAAILDTAGQELTLLRTQRNALDQQKRGLMQRLLTGKVRIKPN